MTYAEKLKDPRWQKKRLKIMERDNFTCQFCQSETKTLNVHHLLYHPNADPWEYEDDELLTLCELCHKGIGLLLNRIKRQMSWEVSVCAYEALTSFLDDRDVRIATILNILTRQPDLLEEFYRRLLNESEALRFSTK